MNSAPAETPKLTAATSGFVLAAAITVLFNTGAGVGEGRVRAAE